MKKNIGLILFLFLLGACHTNNKEESKGYVKLVKVVSAEEISSLNQKQFPSVVQEAKEVNLAFRVAGPIDKVLVKEGDLVAKGQLVATMDARDYKIQQKVVQAQVSQLQSEYKRVAELKSRNGIAANDYEKMKAGKEMAESKLKNANDQLVDTRLYAPFSGYITHVGFESGEMVNHGTSVATLVDISMLKVTIDVPASIYVKRDSIVRFECSQEDIPNKKFPLILYNYNVKANNNGLYRLYLYHQPVLGSKLAPGMNVSVGVCMKEAYPDQLKIPVQAIYEKEGQDFVWRLQGDRVYATQVLVGNSIHEGKINVMGGLSPDDRVVVGGLNLLSEGEKVKIVKPKSKTNIGSIL